MSPIRQEECCVDCDAYTGRAGASDDSLFLDDGRGPFCEFCYYRGRTEELEKELARFRERMDPQKIADLLRGPLGNDEAVAMAAILIAYLTE